MKITSQIVLEYLERFPNTPSLTLAKKIYGENDNHLVFSGVENVRSTIRNFRGSHGAYNRERRKNRKFYKNERVQPT